MAAPTFPTIEVAFLQSLNGNPYNASSNPYGMDEGGHIILWSPAMNYMATTAQYAGDAVTFISGLAEQVAEDAASAAAGSGTEAAVSDIRAGADAEYISIRRILAAMAPVAITFATPLAWDVATGINFTATLTADTTLPNPTNAIAGKSGFIDVVQGGAGGFEITSFGTGYKWFGPLPSWSVEPGSISKLTYFCKSSSEIHLAYAGNAE